MGYNFEELRDEYQSNFDDCKIHEGKKSEIDQIIAKMENNQPRYQKLEDRLGVPWFFIGMIHVREASMNFNTHLANGDSLRERTVHVPAGRPIKGEPPFTWEESAEDALKLQDEDEWTDWSIPGLLYRLEKYNGFGYRKRGVPSPYLWSFSNQYECGKYVGDGKFDPEFKDRQAGAAAILRRMADLEKINLTPTCVPQPTLVPSPAQPGAKPEKYTVKSGDTLSKIAKKLGIADWRELWKTNRAAIPNPDRIEVGQKLIIPGQTSAVDEDSGTTEVITTKDYIIRAGDSWTQIASVYGISPRDLFRLNPQLIKPGTVIQVPLGKAENISLTRVPTNQDALWLQIAEREMETGVEEGPMGHDNPRILEYHSTTTYCAQSDKVPWCSSFVNWCLTEAGYQGTDSAAAISWNKWGKKLSEPRHGCIVVCTRPGGNHVGFYLGDYDEEAINLLGGNQSDAVNIIEWWKEDIISYRWPEESDRYQP